MSTGDLIDYTGRLTELFVRNRFDPEGPVIQSVATLFAEGLSFNYGQNQYVETQSRIATATDSNLNLVALDYLGAGFIRKFAETDAQFRARILLELLRTRASLPSMYAALLALTGTTPSIVNAGRVQDTGGMMGVDSLGNSVGGGLALDTPLAGCLGSISAPDAFQVFINVSFNPSTANVSTDDVLDTINATRPAGMMVWVSVSLIGTSSIEPGDLDSFVLDYSTLG